jgi:vitellogenic carboxypeptidase-like protein
MSLRVVLVTALLCYVAAFFDKRHRSMKIANLGGCADEDCGEEVCITDFLMQNDPAGARNATEVFDVFPNGVQSFAGYASVNATAKNKLFFWYVPAMNGDKDAPLLIWLQGGPGGSSLFGMFAEMGPFQVEYDGTLKKRPVGWNEKYAMIFIDNPVGAGYSYTETEDGYCTDTKTQVSAQLYEMMQQFYAVFPEQLANKLFITGESYAGHYVPGLGHYILTQNNQLKSGAASHSIFSSISGSIPIQIPLAGVAIGDGWIDPYSHLGAYPDMLFNLGLLDHNEKAVVRDYVTRSQLAIEAGDYYGAFTIWDEMINGDIYPYPNYYHNVTGSLDYDNFMNTVEPSDLGYYYSFVTTAATRRGIHAGATTYGGGGNQCEMHLLDDFMVSFKAEVEDLANNMKVLIYSGQLDVIIGAALTEAMMPLLNWSGSEQFRLAKKSVWRVTPEDTEVAGYAKQYDTLTQVVVRGAGHLVPYDQPERALDMLDKWILDVPFENIVNPVVPEL